MTRKILEFFGYGLAPLVTDFVTSNLFYYLLDWSVTLCGMIGFLAGTVVAYFIYLLVTFSERQLGFSWLSLYRYLKSSFLAAVIRAVTLSLLEWLTSWPGFVILLLSLGVSSLVRFLLAHFYVFRKI